MRFGTYTAIGGEEIVTTDKRCGRLILEDKKLFLNEDGIKHPISARDILCIYIINDWFGILPLKGVKFKLDAKIYLPKRAQCAA